MRCKSGGGRAATARSGNTATTAKAKGAAVASARVAEDVDAAARFLRQMYRNEKSDRTTERKSGGGGGKTA